MVFAIAAAIGFFILFRVHSVRTNARTVQNIKRINQNRPQFVFH